MSIAYPPKKKKIEHHVSKKRKKELFKNMRHGSNIILERIKHNSDTILENVWHRFASMMKYMRKYEEENKEPMSSSSIDISSPCKC